MIPGKVGNSQLDLGTETPDSAELIGALVDLEKDPPLWKRRQHVIIGAVSVAALLLAWWLFTSIDNINPIFLPKPSSVARSFQSYISTGQIWPDLATSGKEFILGYLIAVVAGVSIGLLGGWSRNIHSALVPYLWFFLSVPIIALTPLIITWAGVGLEAKIIVVTLGASIPIVVNTMAGVRQLDPSLIRLERSYCANGFQLFRTLALPGSVPFILAGMRLGIGYAVVGTYVGEISTSSLNGVGLMMSNAGESFETAWVFVGLLIFGFAGIVLTAGVGALQKRSQRKRGLAL